MAAQSLGAGLLSLGSAPGTAAPPRTCWAGSELDPGKDHLGAMRDKPLGLHSRPPLEGHTAGTVTAVHHSPGKMLPLMAEELWGPWLV